MSKRFISQMLSLVTLCSAADISQVAVDVRNKVIVVDLIVTGISVPTQSFDASLFSVRDAQTGREFKVTDVSGFEPTTIEISLAADQSVEYGETLIITTRPITIAGSQQAIAPKLYTLPKSAKGSTASALESADGKDDSRFYFDGEISHARAKDIIGTYDLKVSIESRRAFMGTVVRHGPLFALRGGTDPEGDPDSMQLGWNVALPIVVSQSPSAFLALAWENTPTIESTRDFTYSNFIWGSRFRLISRSWTATSGTRFYFRPYGGVEAGRNLTTNIPATKNQAVLRPLIGSTIALVVPLKGDASVSLTGEYIRRWPLKNEVLITTDSTGTILTPSVGTKPRDDLQGTVAVNFTKYAGFAIGYERGSVPPAFKYVDNKLTFGLIIKVK